MPANQAMSPPVPSPLGMPFTDSDYVLPSEPQSLDRTPSSPHESASIRGLPPSHPTSPQDANESDPYGPLLTVNPYGPSPTVFPPTPPALTLVRITRRGRALSAPLAAQPLVQPPAQPAPVQPAPAQPVQQPVPPANTIQPPVMRRMVEVIPLFYGDQTTAENANDFLKAFNRNILLTNPQEMDAQKIDILSNYLGTDSPVEKWYQSLAGAHLTSWDVFTRAFKARWLPCTSATQTSEEYQTELLVLTIPENEVGSIKSVGRQKVWTHVKWVEEALELATLVEIETESMLIWQVKKQLPKVVRKLLDDEYLDWKAFTDAVKGLSTTKLQEEREDIQERARREEEREQKLLQKVEVVN